jgi:hypothetical protein
MRAKSKMGTKWEAWEKCPAPAADGRGWLARLKKGVEIVSKLAFARAAEPGAAKPKAGLRVGELRVEGPDRPGAATGRNRKYKRLMRDRLLQGIHPKPSPWNPKERARRKCVPGAFAQHNGNRAARFCRRWAELGELVAVRTKSGLKFVSRERFLELMAQARAMQEQQMKKQLRAAALNPKAETRRPKAWQPATSRNPKAEIRRPSTINLQPSTS